MISIEFRDDGVAVLSLDRGAANPINLELVRELSRVVKKVRQDPDLRGLVLGTNSHKFFSIGFDIPGMFDLPREGFEVFVKEFDRLCLDIFTLPKPTVAAIGGHAIAGGCILVLCCDYRLIADSRKLMGLNEVKLGVPVPYPCDRMLRSLVGDGRAREVVEAGEFYGAEQSLAMGLVDKVVPSEELAAASIGKVASLSASPPEAFAMIKANRVEKVEAEILARLEEKERLFLDRWYSDDARALLKAAIEKF